MRRSRPMDGSMLAAIAEELTGLPRASSRPPSTSRLAWTPTVVRLADEQGTVEDIVDAAMSGEGPMQRSHLMERRAGAGRYGATESGVVVFEGRRCCVDAMQAVERQLHKIRLPYEFACGGCGAKYAVVGELRG